MPETSPIEKIEAYCIDRKIAESTLGQRAVKDRRAVEYIRRGTAAMNTVKKILAYIDDNPVFAAKGDSPKGECHEG